MYQAIMQITWFVLFYMIQAYMTLSFVLKTALIWDIKTTQFEQILKLLNKLLKVYTFQLNFSGLGEEIKK